MNLIFSILILSLTQVKAIIVFNLAPMSEQKCEEFYPLYNNNVEGNGWD